jgi:AraC-like DNA-binding protein
VGWSRGGWSKEAWDWSPEDGRWSAERHGAPKSAVHVALDTDSLRPHERYDLWREVALYDLDADRRHNATPFQGKASGLIGPSGAVYNNRADALSGSRRRSHADRDGSDGIAIGVVIAGRRRHEEGDERSQSVAGQFLVYDAGRTSRVSWSTCTSVHVTLHRSDVETALGGVGLSSASIARRLDAIPSGRIFAAHLRSLADELGNLDAEEQAGVLGVTLDLAHLALRDVARRQLDDGEVVARGLFMAALGLIDSHLANPDFGSDTLAALLGCSRATLYRCFAERECTIAEVIRVKRLARAHTLLESLGPDLPIADIAMRCGYHDPAYFSRVFRRQYGFSPKDLRG